ncbi:MAG: hypothetical protein Q7J68_03720, partial [Thermoplasmata archaeon]|nr:hypothetical protein [Thermoplasmata archaeon]
VTLGCHLSELCTHRLWRGAEVVYQFVSRAEVMKSAPMNKMQRTFCDQALKAMKEAVAQVIEKRRQRNLPLAFWEHGKIRMVLPKEIPR